MAKTKKDFPGVRIVRVELDDIAGVRYVDFQYNQTDEGYRRGNVVVKANEDVWEAIRRFLYSEDMALIGQERDL